MIEDPPAADRAATDEGDIDQRSPEFGDQPASLGARRGLDGVSLPLARLEAVEADDRSGGVGHIQRPRGGWLR